MYMTDQYPGLDGRSLENSHTNIFAITDLNGIHYRIFSPKDDVNYSIYDDPFFNSYSNCVRKNLMCAWVRRKRVDTEPQKPQIFSNFSKELWVFWYGSDDPVSKERLISPELEEVSSGNWKKGLTYETRCVLFKALHNVIERYLLSKGYVRLGKWFLQPCSGQSIRDKVQYSMNFSFFLHGESTVCASLDIRHFQKFKSLTPRILSLCRKSKGRVNVVLAPYGIIAHLITSFQPSLPNDASVEKELELWKRFYPVQLSGENYNFLNSNTHYGSFNMDFLTPNKSPQQQVSRIDSSTKRIPPNCIEQLPHFVDVLIGGFRTRYPTCFVLIAEDVLSSLTRELQDASDRRVMPAPNTRNTGAEIHSLLHPRLPLTRLPSVKRRAYLAARALQRALRCELSLLPNLDYYHINKIKSRLPIQAPADDALFSGNSDTRKNIRSAILPMHRRFGPMSRTLRAFLSEVDTCGGGGGDAPTTAPRRQLAVADPAMPTLSPQPLNSGAFGMNTLPVVGGDSLSSSSTSAAPPAVSNQQAAHLSSGAKPPCLLNSQLQNIKDGISHNINSKPMDWEETHVAPTTYKLPRGVVRTHQVHKQGGMLTNPPPPQPPPLVRSEASGGEQSWLAEQVLYHVSEQGKCGRSHLRRPPLIRMSLMDQVSPLEHPSTSFPSEVMLKQSCVSDEIARSQRQQYHSQSSGGHPSGSTFGTLVDSHGFGADEANFHPQVQHQQQHHHASQPYFHKQDLPYLTKDSEPHTHEPHTALDGFHRTLEDELHGPGSKLDGHPKGPALMRNLSRHMPISGRSLFSSGGSGHLGAAELATMYPTPPSHESVFSVGAVGGSCTAQPSPTETKPLFVPESHHYSQSPMDESGGVPATRPRQEQGVAHSILQSFLHNSRPLFDQNVVCSHLEWQFMCPRSVQIPFSAKFRISPEELQLYKEVDIATRPPLAFHHLSFSTNGKQESLLVLPRRPPLPPVPSRAPHQHHPSRGLNQTELVFDEPASNTFDLDELRRSDSLKVNLILSDSFLNLFKDHNFDSCNICECTTSVLGVEVDVYVSSPNSAPTRSCNCGFSTLVNRKYALAGNLFWEDESEVASLSIAGVEGRKTHSRPLSTYSTAANYLPTLTQWMHGPLEEFGVRFLIEWLQHTDAALRLDDQPEGTLEKDALYDYSDICALTASALEQSACDPPSLTEGMTGDFAVRVGGRQLRLDETTHKEGVVLHPAFFRQLPGDIPSNKNDQIRLLGSVRLWLQEAIDLLESTYKVEGPLTWKAFHQLAGRGRSESSKAQPIPQFRVGGGANNGKTNVLISPFSVHDWDHLSLTPLSQPKRVAFAVVLPSWQGQQGIGVAASESQRRSVAALSTFFYELSLAFENCMFGRHYPYFQPKAGNPESAFIHVQCAFPHKDENDFSQTNASRHFLKSSGSGSGGGVHFPDTLLHCLHHYKTGVIQAVRKALSERGVAMPDGHCSPILAPFAGQQEKSSPGPLVIASKSGPLNGQGPLTTAFDFYRGTELDVHLVIYLVEPFTQHFDMDDELRNLTTRCMAEAASRMVAQLPASWRQRVSVQLLPMAHITSPRCGLVSGHDGEGTADFLPHVKSMALAVYTSVDRVISPSLINANRTLTGMGPAAEKEVISANFESVHIRRVYSPAYTLAQSHDLWGQWDMHPAEPLQPSSVLFVSYCLSEDQQWLLATCTDQYGTLSQQTFINIRTPESMCTPSGVTVNKSNTATDTSHISARRLALARLWDFIISLLATTSNPWRLVIGRLGRLGHGELRGWCGLLSRKNLQNVNRSLRANCALCNLVTLVPSTSNNNGPSYRGRSTATISLTADSRVPSSCVHETPSLISACLVSTEPHSTFRLFPGSDLNTGDFGGPGGHGSSSHGGGGGGSGGVGGGSGASVSSGSGGVGSGPAGQVPAGPFANGVISAAGYAPSTTHILVFPTSTSAQAQSEQDDINFTEIFGDFYEENEFDDHAAVGMPSLDTLTTPNSAGPGCNLASAVVGGVGGVGPCSGVPQDPNGGGTGLLISSLMRGDVPVEPNTQGMPYEAACRERAKFLLESLLPFGVPDPQSEKPSLMQQPLALGYHVSTAPAGPLPSWFWAACQQTRRNSPVCLKSSLHLHCTLVGVDDDAAAHGGQQCSSNSANAGSHLLDSNVTCDVLRFVLECYNALSWLSYDPCINDRRSCLPVHMLSLAQLYQAAKAFT